jgi:hypothetical protein
MNRIDFLKKLGVGGITAAVVVGGISNVKDLVDIDTTNDTNLPDELAFTILKDGEVFHPLHTNYKVNRLGVITYLNHHNKVKRCLIHKHTVTKQNYIRIKNAAVTVNRFIFEAFTKVRLTQSYIVISKDGNTENVSIDNLKCIRKKDYTKYQHAYQQRKAIRDINGKITKWINI